MKYLAPDFVVFVVPKKLSDGSIVHDVVLGEHTWAATSEEDASDLAEKLAEAIDEHTTHTAGVVYEPVP